MRSPGGHDFLRLGQGPVQPDLDDTLAALARAAYPAFAMTTSGQSPQTEDSLPEYPADPLSGYGRPGDESHPGHMGNVQVVEDHRIEVSVTRIHNWMWSRSAER